jgi:uncharacterized protein YajQ (UPF0234 family)
MGKSTFKASKCVVQNRTKRCRENYVAVDVLELKRQYDTLNDDEIMRVWADQEGLTEIAASVLKEEIAKRGLKGAQFEARTAELKQELRENQQRFERRGIYIQRIRLAIVGLGILIAIVEALWK